MQCARCGEDILPRLVRSVMRSYYRAKATEKGGLTSAARDLECVLRYIRRRPGNGRGGDCCAHLGDLEPVTGAIIGDGCRRRLGKVDIDGPRVEDCLVERKANSGTSSDRCSASGCTRGESSGVAADIIGGDGGDGGVCVGILADVLIRRSCRAVYDQRGPAVWTC
jgi:hypothetical protein